MLRAFEYAEDSGFFQRASPLFPVLYSLFPASPVYTHPKPMPVRAALAVLLS
jgi:hypothetical protein